MSANLNIKAIAAAAGIAAGAISGVSAETLGPVTDPLGVVKIPKGAPIHIGGLLDAVRPGRRYRTGSETRRGNRHG